MKCQRCKEREATVQIMQQVSGKKPQTFFLCEVCARELGISMPSFPMSGQYATNPFALLGNLFQTNFGLGAEDVEAKPSERCSQCGITFEEFKSTGFLGCPQCYETFSSLMDPVFVRTQMGKKHVGRKMGRRSSKGAPEGAEDAASELKKNGAAAESVSGMKQEGEDLSSLEQKTLEKQIEEKREAMTAAITSEDYLLAAKLRDEIAELTKKKEG